MVEIRAQAHSGRWGLGPWGVWEVQEGAGGRRQAAPGSGQRLREGRRQADQCVRLGHEAQDPRGRDEDAEVQASGAARVGDNQQQQMPLT